VVGVGELAPQVVVTGTPGQFDDMGLGAEAWGAEEGLVLLPGGFVVREENGADQVAVNVGARATLIRRSAFWRCAAIA